MCSGSYSALQVIKISVNQSIKISAVFDFTSPFTFFFLHCDIRSQCKVIKSNGPFLTSKQKKVHKTFEIEAVNIKGSQKNKS